MRDLEVILGRVLMAGSAVSTVLLGAGLAVSVLWPPAAAGGWLLRAGLVALMATPALRVFVSAVAYVVQGDWLFAGLTAVVLLVLAGSLAF